MPDVEAVAGAGVVHVVARVVVDQPVVRRVVQALEAQRRAQVVALGGVVVDHVEDHLDAGGMHRPHHRLELLHLLAELPSGGVVGLRSQEAEGVVAPVVAQPLLDQRAVLHELVDGHQLDRGDPEAVEVADHAGMGEPGVGAAEVLRDVRVELGEALDVRLVDQRLVVRRVRAPVALPVEERGDHDAQHHALPGVVVVARVGVSELVAEHRLVPGDVADRGLGVGVEQELGRVAAQPLRGVVGAVDAVAVALAGLQVGQVAVPHERVDLEHRDPGLLARVVEEAQLDLLGDLAEDREVGADPVERRAQRVGATGPDLHECLLVAAPVVGRQSAGGRLTRQV